MSGYIGTQPVPQATQTRDSFTATSNQTSFATGGYTPDFLDVFLNGVKLAAADYTASNGSDVVLATGATTGDILEVVAYTTFEVVTDTVTNAGTVLNLDRTGSNGTILDLKKDGTTVGSIASRAGTSINVNSQSGDLYLQRGGTTGLIVNPTYLTPGADATATLGGSWARFTDLYLSGGVYLGGTGSANKLEDYEFGSWTPAFVVAPSGTVSSLAGQYVKVGNLVTVYMQVAGSSLNLSSYARVQGLPFSASTSNATGTYILGGITHRNHGWTTLASGTNQWYFSPSGNDSESSLTASVTYKTN